MVRVSPAFLAALLAFAPAALAGEEEKPAAPRVVYLRTGDGLTLEADWYKGKEGMPGIVGLHMYPADRTSWKLLAEKRPEGYHFLAVDFRGYGGSRVQKEVDLGLRVKERDPLLFQAMWQDAMAGVKFLREVADCPAGRIGLVGASVGCSIAIDTTLRDGKVAGVCTLTPGKNYLGVPTMNHINSWGDTPLLLLSSEEEADGGARPIAEALKGKPGVDLRIVPGEKIHGTFMFGKVEGIERRIAGWFRTSIGKEILDGRVDEAEGNFENHPSFSSVSGGEDGHSLRGYFDSDGMNFSLEKRGSEACPPGVEVLFAPSDPEKALPEGTRRLRGQASGDGTLMTAWLDTWTGGRWKEEPQGNIPGTAIVRAGVLEGRILWSLVGFGGAADVHVNLKLEGDQSHSGDEGRDWWIDTRIIRWE